MPPFLASFQPAAASGPQSPRVTAQSIRSRRYQNTQLPYRPENSILRVFSASNASCGIEIDTALAAATTINVEEEEERLTNQSSTNVLVVAKYIISRLLMLNNWHIKSERKHQVGNASTCSSCSNLFRLGLALARGVVVSSYPTVRHDIFCHDLSMTKSETREENEKAARHTRCIAHVVLTAVSAQVHPELFRGVLCGFLSYGVEDWTFSGVLDDEGKAANDREEVEEEGEIAAPAECSISEHRTTVTDACWCLDGIFEALADALETRVELASTGALGAEEESIESIIRQLKAVHAVASLTYFFAGVKISTQAQTSEAGAQSCSQSGNGINDSDTPLQVTGIVYYSNERARGTYRLEDFNAHLRWRGWSCMCTSAVERNSDRGGSGRLARAIVSIARTAIEILDAYQPHWGLIGDDANTRDMVTLLQLNAGTLAGLPVLSSTFSLCNDFPILSVAVQEGLVGSNVAYKCVQLICSDVVRYNEGGRGMGVTEGGSSTVAADLKVPAAATASSAFIPALPEDAQWEPMLIDPPGAATLPAVGNSMAMDEGTGKCVGAERALERWEAPSTSLAAQCPGVAAATTADFGVAVVASAAPAAQIMASGPVALFVGLENTGNTCFLNSVTQLLFCATGFRREVVHKVASLLCALTSEMPSVNYPVAALDVNEKTNDAGSKSSPLLAGATDPLTVTSLSLLTVLGAGAVVSCGVGAFGTMSTATRAYLCFSLLLAEMQWRVSRDLGTTIINPALFVSALPSPFNEHSQQDASEFSKVLLECLDNAEKKEQQRDSPDAAGRTVTTTVEEDQAAISAESETSTEHTSASGAATVISTGFSRWFGGTTMAAMRCKQCGHTRSTRSSFWDLSVPLMHSHGQCESGTSITPAVASLRTEGCSPRDEMIGDGEFTTKKHMNARDSPDAVEQQPLALTCPPLLVAQEVSPPRFAVVDVHVAKELAMTAVTTYRYGGALDSGGGAAADSEVSSASSTSTPTTAASSDEKPPHSAEPSSSDAQIVSLTATAHVAPNVVEDDGREEGKTDPPLAIEWHPSSSAAAGTEEMKECPVHLQTLVWRVADPRANVEEMDGDNRLECTRCGTRTATTLSTCVLGTLAEAPSPVEVEEETAAEMHADGVRDIPKYLTLQLNRFRYSRTTCDYEKVCDAVILDEVVLLSVVVADLAAHTEAASSRDDSVIDISTSRSVHVPYRVCAVIVHSGSTPRSGHYFTLARAASRGAHGNGHHEVVKDEGILAGEGAHGRAEDEDGASAPLQEAVPSGCGQQMGDESKTAVAAYVKALTAALSTNAQTTSTISSILYGGAGEGLVKAAVSADYYANWVCINDGSVMAVAPNVMEDIVNGKGGVYGSQDTPYIALYERVHGSNVEGRGNSSTVATDCGCEEGTDVVSLPSQLEEMFLSRVKEQLQGNGPSAAPPPSISAPFPRSSDGSGASNGSAINKRVGSSDELETSGLQSVYQRNYSDFTNFRFGPTDQY